MFCVACGWGPGSVDHDGQCGLGSCSTLCSELMCQACLVPRVCIIRAHAQTITVSSYSTFLTPQTIKQSSNHQTFWLILWLMPVVLICRSLLTGSCGSSECPVWGGEPTGLWPFPAQSMWPGSWQWGTDCCDRQSSWGGWKGRADGHHPWEVTEDTSLLWSICPWGKCQSPLPKRCFRNGRALAS